MILCKGKDGRILDRFYIPPGSDAGGLPSLPTLPLSYHGDRTTVDILGKRFMLTLLDKV